VDGCVDGPAGRAAAVRCGRVRAGQTGELYRAGLAPGTAAGRSFDGRARMRVLAPV